MPIAAGTILKGNIEIERELGSGAMGVVWRARNLALDCPVAVKRLAARVTDDPDARARFAREARAIAKVDSPHVVRIFDYGVTDEDEPFFVMELLRGEDLRARIQSEGPLGIDTTLAIVRQLCLALERAHELGIVHRDLKPANVLVLEQSGPVFVKVLDFGVAKLAGPQELDLTASGGLVGTPYYMSPEQLVEPSRVDARADLWSVAVLAYVCFVGKVPFEGETVGALSLAVHRGVFVPPSEARPGLPAALDAWFRRAFDLDPARRFGSAALVARSLEEAALGSVSPPPDSSPRSESRPGLGAEAPDAAPAGGRSKAAATSAVDESMAGVGASVGATRPVRPTVAVLVVAALLAGVLLFRIASPPVSIATTGGTSAAPPESDLESASATGAEGPGDVRAATFESVERSPTATGAPPPRSASAAQPTAEPRTTKPAPRATPTSRASADPELAPRPLQPPRVDIDGVPIIE